MKKYKVELSTYDEHSGYQALNGTIEANSKVEAKRMLSESAIEDGKIITIRGVDLIDGKEEEDEENITYTAYLRGEHNGIGFMKEKSDAYNSKEEAISFAKSHNWDGVMDDNTGEIIWEKPNKKIYAVDLCYYTDENVPECGTVIFIRSDKDIAKIPTYLIKEDIFVKEAMENNDCEGIGNIIEISEEEFYEEYPDEEIIEVDI